jgi:hypothetical protein
MKEKSAEDAAGKERPVAVYEPPQVETVLTAEEIEREAHYAGGVTVTG